MPRSRGQSAYYELYCTCKLGEGLKKDFNGVTSIETEGKRVIPPRNYSENTEMLGFLPFLLIYSSSFSKSSRKHTNKPQTHKNKG